MGPTRSLALASAWIAPNTLGVEPAQFVLHLLQVCQLMYLVARATGGIRLTASGPVLVQQPAAVYT